MPIYGNKERGTGMYKKMYLQLFNAVTDSLEAMEAQNFGQARELLIAAQQVCEEIYMDADEEE